MIDFRKIYEGWRNLLVPDKDMKDYIRQVSKERMALCRVCKFHSGKGYCTLCKCPDKAHTSCLSCRCAVYDYPDKTGDEHPKWDKVLFEDEEINLDNDLGTWQQ